MEYTYHHPIDIYLPISYETAVKLSTLSVSQMPYYLEVERSVLNDVHQYDFVLLVNPYYRNIPCVVEKIVSKQYNGVYHYFLGLRLV